MATAKSGVEAAPSKPEIPTVRAMFWSVCGRFAPRPRGREPSPKREAPPVPTIPATAGAGARRRGLHSVHARRLPESKRPADVGCRPEGAVQRWFSSPGEEGKPGLREIRSTAPGVKYRWRATPKPPSERPFSRQPGFPMKFHEITSRTETIQV